MNDSPRVGAVILAGGLARRMGGQDKGLIKLAGKPMVQYVVEAIKPEVDECVINANRNVTAYEQFGLPVITDNLKGHLGPLAGLSTAIDVLETDYVFMCPCDSPFMQSELFRALRNGCLQADADVAIAHDGERLQPVFCLVHRRVKPSLDTFLAAGERKIDRWFEKLAQVQIPSARYADSFLNINTKEERLAAEQVMLNS